MENIFIKQEMNCIKAKEKAAKEEAFLVQVIMPLLTAVLLASPTFT